MKVYNGPTCDGPRPHQGKLGAWELTNRKTGEKRHASAATAMQAAELVGWRLGVCSEVVLLDPNVGSC